MAQDALPYGISTSDRGQRRRWRVRRIAAATVLLVFACLLLFCWYIGVFGGNVRTVTAGRVYRSAQLTGQHLDSVLDLRGIRTVINLRGESSDADWYRSEVESCQKRKISHIDIALSAGRLPPPDELKKLLIAFDKAEYPILFHCKGGADRSGMAGVLYQAIYQNVPFEKALADQLTWRYGHLSGYYGGRAVGQAHAMDDFFNLYRMHHNGLKLRDWIGKIYPSLYPLQPASLRSPATDEAPRPPKSSRQPVAAGR